MTLLRSSPVRAVRTHLGLSQGALARYLGVSRSLLSQVEAAERELSAAANQKLDRLMVLLPVPLGLAIAVPPALAPVETDAAQTKPLRDRLRTCRHEAARLRVELEDMQTRATKARNCLQVVPALLADLPPGTDHDRLWLETLAADATTTLARCGAPAQTLLTLRISALDFEAAEAERIISGR